MNQVPSPNEEPYPTWTVLIRPEREYSRRTHANKGKGRLLKKGKAVIYYNLL